MEKLLGIPDVYMQIIMNSNYRPGDIFRSKEQVPLSDLYLPQRLFSAFYIVVMQLCR